MTNELILSRYSILFINSDGVYLCYNSRKNIFLALSQELYNLLARIPLEVSELPIEILNELLSNKIIVPQQEDQNYYEYLKLNNCIQSYNKDHIGITLVPTTSCNLKCPYCFEFDKQNNIINNHVIDTLIQFINKHQQAKTLSLTWYGGEPLLVPDKIDLILKRLKDETELNLTYHSIITNGVLLNEKAINIFKEHPLNQIQITFDGMSTTHNTKRFLPNKKGTFDIILSNIKKYLNVFPQSGVNIRINIDNNNRNEYAELHDFLEKELNSSEHNIFIYPGVLKDENIDHSICNNSLMTPSDIKNFHLNSKNFKQHYDFYPKKRDKGCAATRLCNYVIGPLGEIYKCWLEVGNQERVIGNIADTEFQRKDLFTRYLISGTCFDDIKCIDCPLLPICSGGCPQKRLLNKYEGYDFNLCTMYHLNENKALEEFLQMYYLLKKRIN